MVPKSWTATPLPEENPKEIEERQGGESQEATSDAAGKTWSKATLVCGDASGGKTSGDRRKRRVGWAITAIPAKTPGKDAEQQEEGWETDLSIRGALPGKGRPSTGASFGR